MGWCAQVAWNGPYEKVVLALAATAGPRKGDLLATFLRTWAPGAKTWPVLLAFQSSAWRLELNTLGSIHWGGTGWTVLWLCLLQCGLCSISLSPRHVLIVQIPAQSCSNLCLGLWRAAPLCSNCSTRLQLGHLLESLCTHHAGLMASAAHVGGERGSRGAQDARAQHLADTAALPLSARLLLVAGACMTVCEGAGCASLCCVLCDQRSACACGKGCTCAAARACWHDTFRKL